MARKFTLFVVVILFMVMLWIIYSNHKGNALTQKPTDHELNQPSNERKPGAVEVNKKLINNIKNPTDEVGDKSTTPVSKKLDDEALLKNLLAETSSQRYSDDPVIEMASVMIEIASCGISRSFSRWEYIKPTAAWNNLNQQAEKNCNQLKQQYPTISNEEQDERVLMLLAPTSIQGRLLMDAYKALEQSQDDYLNQMYDLFYLGVTSENAQLIQMAKLFSSAGSGRDSGLFPYQEIIQTEDNHYLMLIDQLALEAMACNYNDGITGQAQSYAMLDRCKQVAEVCGLNFKQWFVTYVPTGIKADVNLLMAFYQQLKP